MKVKRKIIAALFLLALTPGALFTGCTKNGGVCVTNTGPVITQDRSLSGFDSISLFNYVNLILTHDSVDKVVVEAGQNIIGGISTRIENRQLIISNNNSCNWLRSFKQPINVYVSCRNIWRIYYQSSGNITSLNTLKFDSLKVEVWGGCGTIDLDLKIFSGYFILNTGTADFRLRGHCDINSVFTGEYGKFDGTDLYTRYSFITNNGSNDSYVRVSEHLEGIIGNIGNIYYTGNPKTIEETVTGSGKMIPF